MNREFESRLGHICKGEMIMFRAARLKAHARKILKLKDKLSADLTSYYDYLLYCSKKPGGIEVVDSWEIRRALR